MNVFNTLLLSIVEGISEFLPISSTGHLILASHLLQIEQTEFVKTFEIVIQLGAIMAIVVLYFKKLVLNFDLWKKVAVSFIPTVIFGALFYDFIKAYLIGNSSVVTWSLLIGGVFMIWFEKYYKHKEKKAIALMDYVLIGLFQVISMIPGVSRAMVTIFGGMAVGMNRKSATEFSFFLAIPTMFAASALDIISTPSALIGNNLTVLLIGFIGSFVTALLVIRWLVRFVQTNNFVWFGVYRILIGILILFYL